MYLSFLTHSVRAILSLSLSYVLPPTRKVCCNLTERRHTNNWLFVSLNGLVTFIYVDRTFLDVYLLFRLQVCFGIVFTGWRVHDFRIWKLLFSSILERVSYVSTNTTCGFTYCFT